MGRRTPPRMTMPELTEQEVKELMASDYLPPPPRPRIRATTPNPSRTARDAEDAERRDAMTGRPYTSIDSALEKINALYAWAEEHDPQPAWWKWRARREWRNRWGIT